MKSTAFFPALPAAALSVAHISDLVDTDAWKIAKATLGSEPGRRTVYARADLAVGAFSVQRLRVLRDDVPFQRHTSVVDWPKHDDPNETKQLIKAVTLELSQTPTLKLVIPNSPIVRSSAL